MRLSQVVWKAAFHGTVTRYRSLAPTSQASVELADFLNSGLGFYGGLLETLGYSPLGFRDEAEDDERESAERTLAHRFYICMGDIARYQAVMLPTTATVQNENAARVRLRWPHSASLYQRALELKPNDGTPFNQLAVLASAAQNDPYSESRAASYYFQSLSTTSPGPTTPANLESLFKRLPPWNPSALPTVSDVSATWKKLPQYAGYLNAGLVHLWVADPTPTPTPFFSPFSLTGTGFST